MAGGKSTNCICRFIVGNIIEPINFGKFSHACLITAGYIYFFIVFLDLFDFKTGLRTIHIRIILLVHNYHFPFPRIERDNRRNNSYVFFPTNVSTAEETPVMKTKYQKICRKQVSTVSISSSMDIVLNIHKIVWHFTWKGKHNLAIDFKHC